MKPKKDKRGRQQKNSEQSVPSLSPYQQALQVAEVERHLAMRWQQVAAVPEADFNAYLGQPAEVELTTADLLRRYRIKKRKRDMASATLAGSGIGQIHALDCFELLSELQGKVDLLLTDPPYMTEVDDIRSHALSVCSWLQVLKPNGRAYIFTGAYPLEIGAYLDALREDWIAAAGLVLANVVVWTYENAMGPAPSHDYRLNWHACFYLRGRDASPLHCPSLLEHFAVQRVNAPDGRIGDRLNAWQKPDEIAERFIRHATESGDTVWDPYAGTGTFVAAAKRLGRMGIGAENDPAMLDICRERGLEVCDA